MRLSCHMSIRTNEKMNKDILPVLDEISAILKKHDMAGLIVVANGSHCDWRMEIEASWSCARLEKDQKGGTFLGIRSKLVDYPSKEAQKEKLETTVGTFVTFSDVLVRLNENVTKVLVLLCCRRHDD